MTSKCKARLWILDLKKTQHFKKHYWVNLGISCSQETYATAFRSEGSFFFSPSSTSLLPSPPLEVRVLMSTIYSQMIHKKMYMY